MSNFRFYLGALMVMSVIIVVFMSIGAFLYGISPIALGVYICIILAIAGCYLLTTEKKQ